MATALHRRILDPVCVNDAGDQYGAVFLDLVEGRRGDQNDLRALLLQKRQDLERQLGIAVEEENDADVFFCQTEDRFHFSVITCVQDKYVVPDGQQPGIGVVGKALTNSFTDSARVS